MKEGEDTKQYINKNITQCNNTWLNEITSRNNNDVYWLEVLFTLGQNSINLMPKKVSARLGSSSEIYLQAAKSEQALGC